jgi:deoxycytidine triphosphate deaminase
MILSYRHLCDIVDSGFITHVLPDNINGSSIDVRIGEEVLIERFVGSPELKTISLRDREPLETIRHDLKQEPLYLYPGECILAHTIEMFNLPGDLSAMFKLKSSCGRIFLEHMNAGWCDAYWHGSALTMELKNMSRQHVIKLQYGDAIGQMIFFPHLMVPEDMGYAQRGRYNKDKGVSGTKKVLVFGDQDEDAASEAIIETMEKPLRSIETGRLEATANTGLGEDDD